MLENGQSGLTSMKIKRKIVIDEYDWRINFAPELMDACILALIHTKTITGEKVDMKLKSAILTEIRKVLEKEEL